jgi:hypothetical protein
MRWIITLNNPGIWGMSVEAYGRMSMKKSILLSFASVLFAATPAIAQNFTCTTSVVAQTFSNVTVPHNADCNLSANVTVLGNIIVASGATLHLGFNTIVHGNVTANGAADILSNINATIGGNVILVGTMDVVFLESTNISGNLIITAMTGRSIAVLETTVGQNMILTANKTASGPGNNVIGDNTIGGNLVCEGNTPPPTGDSPLPKNVVSGHNIGQCAGL